MTDTYTIPLQKIFNNKPRRGRAKKAIREIKEFVKKHKRLNEDQIAVSNEVNEKVWARGMFGIPRKIEVQLKEIEGKTFVFLKEGKELKEKEKEAKEQKKEQEKEKKKTEEEIEAEKEKEKKLKEKRQKEKDAEKTDIKRKIRE
jgi:ribosomal protein L31E